MSSVIERLTAIEILDSRGRPTLQVTLVLEDGTLGTASVPSGASTGSAEALELRDGDPHRYKGLGCRQAVAHVDETICQALRRRIFDNQREFDEALLALDGTADKSNLGANAILGASLAFARAVATQRRMPLYTYFAELLGHPPASLPLPMINLFSGGMHAGGQVPLQDLQVIPVSANTIDEALALTFDIFHAAADLSRRRYGMRLLRADEGGLAPDFPGAEAMFEAAVEAIQAAGYHPGEQVLLAIDVAASHFYQQGYYHLGRERLDSEGMIARLLKWLAEYPIASFEDPLAEEDWTHWFEFCKLIGDRAQVIGDDLLCTNPIRIRQAIESRAANSLLLKVNQVGTLTEAAEACHLAKAAGWRVIASARSGDTEDDWLADLAVGWSADHIKVGSITQSERLAKYNRLLKIESVTGLRLAKFNK